MTLDYLALKLVFAVLTLAAVAAALFRYSPVLLRRYSAWRERRRRMQWFADEFLPELMSAATRAGVGVVAGDLAQSQTARVVNEPEAPKADEITPESLRRLNQVLSRLPQSEIERLKALVSSRG